MFIEEAKAIEAAIEQIGLPERARVLDIGSSDLRYRTVTQPHIERHIHKPLRDRGVTIHFLDIKDHEGVDIVADLSSTNPKISEHLDAYDLILCCNILEHVPDRDIFIRNLLRFSHQDTYLMLTVPRAYPKHNDPIDTMYRPTVSELTQLIQCHRQCSIVSGKELTITDKQYYKFKAGRWLNRINLLTLRMLLRWHLKPLRWRVTYALLIIEE